MKYLLILLIMASSLSAFAVTDCGIAVIHHNVGSQLRKSLDSPNWVSDVITAKGYHYTYRNGYKKTFSKAEIDQIQAYHPNVLVLKDSGSFTNNYRGISGTVKTQNGDIHQISAAVYALVPILFDENRYFDQLDDLQQSLAKELEDKLPPCK